MLAISRCSQVVSIVLLLCYMHKIISKVYVTEITDFPTPLEHGIMIASEIAEEMKLLWQDDGFQEYLKDCPHDKNNVHVHTKFALSQCELNSNSVKSPSDVV